MSLGQLGMRNLEDLGFDSPGLGLLGYPGCPWDNEGSGTWRIWDLTPLVLDYLGYPGMSLGQLGVRDLEDVG